MSLRTVDVDSLATQTGNIYEAVAILSKRSRQISTTMKAELDDKLAYFEGFESDFEDPRFREEQTRISLEYERKVEPTEVAIEEMLNQELFYRASGTEIED
jgi:DNA-directed RNA polymerase subunit K/omega